MPLVIGELPPLADFGRGAEATDTEVSLAVELADIETWRCQGHG
jgi:hypothetical protein